MFADHILAADFYPVLRPFTPPAQPTKPAWAFKLRCPAPKTGKVPAGVRLVKWEDTPFPRNVTTEMRGTVEDLDRLGIPWTLYHANVVTRIPWPRSAREGRFQGYDGFETHPYQIEAVYIPSLRRIAVIWYPWAGIRWIDTRGDIDRDLAVFALQFSQTLTD